MFKFKRKEKPKRGKRLINVIALLVLILMIAGGAVSYWFYNAYTAAVEPPVVSMGDVKSIDFKVIVPVRTVRALAAAKIPNSLYS